MAADQAGRHNAEVVPLGHRIRNNRVLSIDLQTNSNTYKTTHTIYLLIAEPRRIRFTTLPPGEDFDFDLRLNRFGVVVVVVVVVVVGRPLDKEALERLTLRAKREVAMYYDLQTKNSNTNKPRTVPTCYSPTTFSTVHSAATL